MPAYVVFMRERMRDEAEFQAYRALSSAPPENARILAAHGKLAVVEGANIETAVIMEFPTMQEAESWYESPEYQAASRRRFAAADHRVFILDGI